MIFLVDHHLEGQAITLLGNISNQGWLELIDISFVTLEDVDIPVDSSVRSVRR